MPRTPQPLAPTPGSTVLLLQPPPPADSPEFDYLHRLRQREIRAAFAGCHLASDEDKAELVLRIASERVLVLRPTLAQLAAAVRRGAAAAYADTLAARQGNEPILTLRSFERREARLLASGCEPGSLEEALQAPVSLWRAEVWRERTHGSHGPIVRMGLSYEFKDYYGDTRMDVLPFVPVGVREVLEIGCARGLTGALLQERLGCRVTGVELNPQAAREAASRLAEVIVGDVETLELSRTFDAVVALELFEHLRDPFAFLEKVRRWLRPEGVMILSTPNVGHWSVVRDLLEGRWDYLPMGLLCFTHLRFFTRKSLRDLLELGGFAEVQLVPQRNPVPASFAKVLRKLPGVDWESLDTQGFWVIARNR